MFYMGAMNWLIKKCESLRVKKSDKTPVLTACPASLSRMVLLPHHERLGCRGYVFFIESQLTMDFPLTLLSLASLAVIAAASPFIGQGESACMVRPFVDLMTPSELHLAMTSGFSTISGSVLAGYILLGVPASSLITASMMSIPASIAISKIVYPEDDVPVTLGRIVVDRGEEDHAEEANALHAFSRGAALGLKIAGLILCNGEPLSSSTFALSVRRLTVPHFSSFPSPRHPCGALCCRRPPHLDRTCLQHSGAHSGAHL